jgi:phosphatidylglycerol:prolipoprotein diacylglycerol transferase
MRYPLIDFGTLPIYNFMAGCGLILGLLLFIRNLRDYHMSDADKDRVLLLFALAFIAGIGLSNVGNWFIMPGMMNLPLLTRIQSAGLSFYFGLIGFLTISSLLLRAFKFNVYECLNYIIPSLLLFHTFGRIGCSLGGCCFGKVVNWSFFNTFVITRFPAREMEAFCLFIMFLLTQYWIRKHRLVFYLYAYPITRFFLEFGRGDNRGWIATGILSPAQIISITILAATSIFLLLKAINRRDQIRSYV